MLFIKNAHFAGPPALKGRMGFKRFGHDISQRLFDPARAVGNAAMDVFDILTMIGGLCLFLFGMNVMSQALERRAGPGLRGMLGKMTTKKSLGFLTGMGITAVIQSSSATTVMVVGFVNSGLMTLRQSINVIMGANVGTTVTAWILSLTGIESDSFIVQLFKPSSFTPILALIGIIFLLFCKSSKKKDTGTILLGFSTLMFGMETMSDTASVLADIPAFQQLFIFFENPILGLLVGAALTCVIQSSSASVGILQALATTGQITYGAAIPIIMGQNIGTCVTALISSVGANKNAKRAAMVHLSFNVFGAAFWMIIFCIVKAVFSPAVLGETATTFGIAIAHSIFNILCTALMMPFSGLLEKFVTKIIPDSPEEKEEKEKDKLPVLEERLLATPSIAVERCRDVTESMADLCTDTFKESLECLKNFDPDWAKKLRHQEELTDKYEDMISTYIVKMSAQQMSEKDSMEATKLMKVVGDFERIADHAVNIVNAGEEMYTKHMNFSDDAKKEMDVMISALNEIIDRALAAFKGDDIEEALMVEPLETVIDNLKEKLRTNHVNRLRKGMCSEDAAYVWSDLLNDMERASDHCSNIAGCILDIANNNMNMHETLRDFRAGTEHFGQRYEMYEKKYWVD